MEDEPTRCHVQEQEMVGTVEKQPDRQTWTWFEAESGERYAIPAWYPFPFVSEADLSHVLENARI